MSKSLKAQFKYAGKLEVPFTAILGGDELAKGVVKLRDMNGKDEQELPLDGAAEAIAALLRG